MKRLIGVIFVACGVVVGILALNLFLFVETPAGGAPQVVVVDRGTSTAKIIDELGEKGIVSNSALFRAYVILRRASGKIRAGEYHFEASLRPREVLDLLLKGDFARRRITIPEGWNSRDIATYLGELGLVDPERFLQKCRDEAFIRSLGLSVPSLEGYLYPDTYEIYKPKDEEEVLRKLVARFQKIYDTTLEARGRETGLGREQVIILASMVEKETARPEERPVIASVFLNRLKKEMPLASDPTIIYSITDFSGNLTRQHLTRPSPYNTYVMKGLPATAIASPGIDSIRAVLYPAQTDFLYFVSKNDGTHEFSRTEEEHNASVKRYQSNRPRPPAETLPKTPTVP